jgi:hypothetical protein
LADEKLWRRFPHIEHTFEPGQLTVTMQRIERTCRQLDNVIKTGSPEEKARAQMAMTAYGRTLELLKQLSEIRERPAKQS